jgi:hypothetical protein
MFGKWMSPMGHGRQYYDNSDSAGSVPDLTKDINNYVCAICCLLKYRYLPLSISAVCLQSEKATLEATYEKASNNIVELEDLLRVRLVTS